MNIIRKNGTMISFLIIALGGIFTIIGAYVQYNNKVQEQKKALETERKRTDETQKLLEKTNAIILSQEKVIDQTGEIVKLQGKLEEKNVEISKLQSQTIDQITGGNEIPKLWFHQSDGFHMTARLYNNSKLPIKNVTVRIKRDIFDYAVTHPAPPTRSLFPDEFKEYNFKVGDLGISYDEQLYFERYLKNYDDINYEYFVRWQNGFYHGFFRIQKEKDKHKVTMHWIQDYQKGFDLSKAVIINGIFSHVNELSE